MVWCGGGLEDLDRQFLVERQLISREHADATFSSIVGNTLALLSGMTLGVYIVFAAHAKQARVSQSAMVVALPLAYLIMSVIMLIICGANQLPSLVPELSRGHEIGAVVAIALADSTGVCLYNMAALIAPRYIAVAHVAMIFLLEMYPLMWVNSS